MSTSRASSTTPSSALRSASLTAQPAKMPSRSITNDRVPSTSKGMSPVAMSARSRFSTPVKVTSADPAGMGTVVPLRPTSVAGSWLA